MAGVNAIAIRGIRSFGPDEHDLQRLTFSKPLTLILGQNGCGKTTIIESLKYAITGQFPPGSKNECFVYDAKVNKTPEVNGQVHLKVFNMQGKEVTVSRSMQVTTKLKKTTFKTLDASISHKADNGSIVEISSRCADIDQFMFEQLGVSKAIINSVIFCHQEDSSWPLDEGKKVKERFDEIFDADKYSACFDKLKKMRKENAVNVKVLTEQVAHLLYKKSEIDKKKLDIVNTESKISESEIKLLTLEKEFTPLSEKLKNIQTLEMNLVKYETKREKAKLLLENCISQQEELKKAIKNIFTGSLESLESNINSYESLSRNKKKELESLQSKIQTLNKEEIKLNNEISANKIKFSNLTLLEQQNQERIDQLRTMIIEAVGQTDLPEPDQIESEEQIKRIISSLHQNSKTRYNDIRAQQADADKEEKRLQKLVDDSRDALSRHMQKITTKESDLKELKRVLSGIENEIKDTEKSKSKLETIESQLKTVECDYENLTRDLDSETLQAEINESEKILERKEEELEEMNKEIGNLQAKSAKQAEVNLKQDNLNSKEKMLTTLKNKHRASLSELLNEMPVRNFALSVNECETNIRKEFDSMKQKLKELQHNMTTLEANRKHTRDLCNTKKTELTSAEDRIYKVCGTLTYEAALHKIDSTVAKYQEEKNLLSSSQFIIVKYKDQIQKHHNCPLCNRGFDSELEVTDLVNDLTMKIKDVPANLERVTEELQRSSARRDDLLALKSVQEKIVTLKENEIPKLEAKLKELDSNLQTLNDEIEEMSMSLMEPEQKLSVIRQLSSEMTLIDKSMQEVQSLKDELLRLRSQLPGDGSIKDINEVIELKDALRKETTAMKQKIKKDQSTLNSFNKKVQTLMHKKNSLKEEYLNLTKRVQELYSLQEKLTEGKLKVETLNAELKILKESTENLKIELRERENDKNITVSKQKTSLESKRTAFEKFKNMIEKIQAVDSEIKEHNSKNIMSEITKLKQVNVDHLNRVATIDQEKGEFNKRVEEYKDELSKREIYKRDLEDNFKLRKYELDAEKLQNNVEKINEEIGGLDSSMISQKQKLIHKQKAIYTEQAELNGSIKELKDRVAVNKAELQKSDNKNVENEYRKHFYELEILKAMDKDIKDYSAAMDKCLMEFHKEKMGNINLIIRELWRKIYRGNDIDCIEIKTEGSTVTEKDGRRKYEYRVVQYKNGVEIDMRGRCSAGQKVLACLIIRLALAETFSTKFGVLALDEPTTNLDHENVRSLCDALGEIVTERMRQKNFMFIIITHDRDFIESLGNIDKVTHFYEVSRNEEGKSRIKKQKLV